MLSSRQKLIKGAYAIFSSLDESLHEGQPASFDTLQHIRYMKAQFERDYNPPHQSSNTVWAARLVPVLRAGQSSSTTRASLLSPRGSGSDLPSGCSARTGCKGRSGRRSPKTGWCRPPPARRAGERLSAGQSPPGPPWAGEQAGGLSSRLWCSPGPRPSRCGCPGWGGASTLHFQLARRGRRRRSVQLWLTSLFVCFLNKFTNAEKLLIRDGRHGSKRRQIFVHQLSINPPSQNHKSIIVQSITISQSLKSRPHDAFCLTNRPKSKRLFIYSHTWQRETANPAV